MSEEKEDLPPEDASADPTPADTAPPPTSSPESQESFLSDEPRTRDLFSRRRSQYRPFYIVLAVVALAALVVACGQNGGSPAAGGEEDGASALDGKALVEERCSGCHDLARVERAQKTEAEWQTNVERMVAKGANLNKAEQDAVVKYLAEAYPK